MVSWCGLQARPAPCRYFRIFETHKYLKLGEHLKKVHHQPLDFVWPQNIPGHKAPQSGLGEEGAKRKRKLHR